MGGLQGRLLRLVQQVQDHLIDLGDDHQTKNESEQAGAQYDRVSPKIRDFAGNVSLN